MFDTKHTSGIDYEEFVAGCAQISGGSEDGKMHFFFHLYDLNDDQCITRAELRAILRHVPLEHLNLPPCPPHVLHHRRHHHHHAGGDNGGGGGGGDGGGDGDNGNGGDNGVAEPLTAEEQLEEAEAKLDALCAGEFPEDGSVMDYEAFTRFMARQPGMTQCVWSARRLWCTACPCVRC
jgi:hypothetical protein